MKKIFVIPAMVLGIALGAHAQAAPTKVAVIQVQTAILSTKDGQKAAADLQAKFAPKKAEIDKKQADVAGLQDQLKKGQATMSEDAKSKLMRDIDKKQADVAGLQDQLKKGQATMSEDAKSKLMRDIDSANTKLQRDTQDAQADLDEEQQKIMQELGSKMMAVVEKYAQQNGLAMVIDVSNPQTPVLWAAQAVDITNDIVKLYDQSSPGAGAAAAKPAGAGTPPAAVPPAPAPKKK